MFSTHIPWTLVGAGLVVSAFRASDDVVRAERVELVDRDGVRQAILSADTTGFAVTLLDERGRPTAILRLNTEPRITVETGDGEEVAWLGAPKVRHLKE